MQLAGACSQAKAVISVDAGPLHIAAVGTPTYAMVGNDGDGVGASPVRLWMPCCSNVTRSISPVSAPPLPTTDFATTIVWLMVIPAWLQFSRLVIAWMKSQLA